MSAGGLEAALRGDIAAIIRRRQCQVPQADLTVGPGAGQQSLSDRVEGHGRETSVQTDHMGRLGLIRGLIKAEKDAPHEDAGLVEAEAVVVGPAEAGCREQQQEA